jgi:hypothetical protein
MLIVALVLAVVGLAALVTAVVTSNELIAWVCIAASVVGVLLLIVDALRDRSKGDEPADEVLDETDAGYAEDYPEETPVAADYEDGAYEDASYEETPADEPSYEATPEHDPHAEPAGGDSTKS